MEQNNSKTKVARTDSNLNNLILMGGIHPLYWVVFIIIAVFGFIVVKGYIAILIVPVVFIYGKLRQSVKEKSPNFIKDNVNYQKTPKYLTDNRNVLNNL